MFNIARILNKTEEAKARAELAARLLASGALLGIVQGDIEAWFSGDGELTADDIEAMIVRRNAARADKDFAAADSIRDELAAQGISIEDGADGTRWRRSG